MPDPQDVGFDEASLDAIAAALAKQGYAVCPGALDPALLARIDARRSGLATDAWAPAGTGRAHGFRGSGDARGDKIAWLSADDAVEAAYLRVMEALRLGLNQRLFLGLFDYESHFAVYPVGGHYRRHVDALVGRSNRTISVVLYLNERWDRADGGELLLYPATGDTPLRRVLPEMGTLVLFMSVQFPHEVTTAARERRSVAGWFRVNASDSLRVDPAR